MKHYQLLLLFLSIATMGFAQTPVNDNCSGLIDLGVAPACPEGVFYSNVGATPSDIGFGNIPTCFNGGGTQRDVWFAFTTSDTIFDYTITVTGLTDGTTPGMVNPQIALYRGDCEVDGLAELLCATAENGETVIELDALGLTPGIPYFIRINDYSATATPNAGTFQLCVTEVAPANNIDEGSSSACTGLLYDTGGPDEDYSANENHTFTICPDQPHSCITFTLEYYNIEDAGFFATDQLTFYDSDIADPGAVIASIGGTGFGTGVSPGGAVCFQVQATSGCLTVQFVSDGNNNFEGFAGSWECSTQECPPAEAITVEGDISTDEIVDFISTPQTTVTITDINCPDRAYGLFQATDESGLGLERGLLLTTGDLNWAPGPNDDGGGGNFNASNLAPGDDDLDYLSTISGNGSLSNDACIIELDVFAATNELTFEYIFGSEEYPEFVNQNFNDIFAFLVSGPGIIGDPNMGNQLNIAVLPDGSGTPVQINSVNNLLNWEYYRNNEISQTIQYDGLTSDFLGVKKSLTARTSVIPCNTYHLKLAIADRQDFVYDSGVFISDLKGGTPNLNVVYNSGIDYLLEDCTSAPDQVTISLNNPLEDPVTYTVVVGGTAIRDVDYILDLPGSITIQPGQTVLSFPIQPLSDMIDEATETIVISLTNNFGCGTVVYTTLTIELRDELNIEVQGGVDTALVCANSSILLNVVGASSYFWTPIPVFDNPTSPTPVATPPMSMWVNVEGRVGPLCVDNDSIYLQIVDPQISLLSLDPVNICRGDSVRMVVTDNVNHQNLTWTPSTYLNDASIPNPVSTPFQTTTYVASVEVAGCMVSDSLTINVDAFDFPQLASDTTICQNYSVILAEFIDPDTTTTQYAWSPASTLDDPTSSAPLATPEFTTTYTLTATSASGFCSAAESVTVTVIPTDVAIQQPDTVEICLGSVVNLTATTNTGNALGLEWLPNNGTLSDTTGLQIIASPTVSTTYYAVFSLGSCVVTDSIHIRVDSLPLQGITAIPAKPFYCQDEIVTFVSPTYEPGHFPDIEHQWLPGLGFESSDTLWNLVISALDTFTYQRVTRNHACIDTASISINVIEARPMSVTPADTTICPGQPVQLTLNYDGQGEISWEPATGLSCDDCFTPIASPPSTTTYVVKAQIGECVQQTSATVVVITPPAIGVIDDLTICQDETDPVQLNTANQPNVVYTWSSPQNPNFTSNNPLLEVLPDQTTTYVLSAQNACFNIQDQVTVSVIDNADFSVEGATICAGESVTLTAVSNVPAGIQETYTWTAGGQTYTGKSITISGLTDTTVVEVTMVFGPNCGSVTRSATVNVIGDAFMVDLAILPADTVITGDTLTLTADVVPSGLNIASYTWYEDGVQIGQTTEPTFTHIAPFLENSPAGQNITYSVSVELAEGCSRDASGTILVLPANFQVPNVFTPDGSGKNDIFKVFYRGGYDLTSFRVYNRWGQLVYEGSGANAQWDGTHKGKEAPSDVYVYYIELKLSGRTFELKGDVTLVR